MSVPTPPAPPAEATSAAGGAKMAAPPATPQPPPVPEGMLGDAAAAQPPPVEYYREQQSFWRQPWVQNVLPLATSLALHLSLIVIGFATYKTVQKVVQVVKEQIIIPESTMADNGPPGGIQHPGLGADPTRDAAQDLVKDASQDAGWATKATDELNQTLAGGAASDADSSLISIGANASTGGKGNGIGGGGADGGQLAPFGVPGGGAGMGPKSNFAGTGGNAHQIMYFCDASGSMLSVFTQLKLELKRSIDALKPVQSFNVVFYRDDQYYALSKDGLVMASPDNKRKAYEFIDSQVSTGSTQPIPAIKFALSQKPQLMYLLTDGFDQIANFDDVINTFKNGNTEKKIHVNCIFLKSNDDPNLERVLRQIATENGGLMKIIAKSEF